MLILISTNVNTLFPIHLSFSISSCCSNSKLYSYSSFSHVYVEKISAARFIGCQRSWVLDIIRETFLYCAFNNILAFSTTATLLNAFSLILGNQILVYSLSFFVVYNLWYRAARSNWIIVSIFVYFLFTRSSLFLWFLAELEIILT